MILYERFVHANAKPKPMHEKEKVRTNKMKTQQKNKQQ